mmetsp:Transcript_9492/g.17861  ORF Transcript_9492/g.17861 Transcript_9492/m.17861 type:complete len:289 (+) Transcript_9492:110-976(+)
MALAVIFSSANAETHSPLKSKSHDDTCSLSLNSSSVHDMLAAEIDRRKERLRKIREHRRLMKMGNDKIRDGTPLTNTSQSSGDTQSSYGVKGIMTVRTVDESLHGGKLSEMKKLRRRFTIKIKGVENTVHDDLEDCSVGSTFSSSTASMSTATMGDLALGFTQVHIREYVLVPGVNPSVLSGPPIELGWAHTELSTFHIEEWEKSRDGKRRLQSQMKIPPDVRRGLLLHHGNPQKSIRDATRNAANARKQRMQTLDKLNTMGSGFDEKVDSFKKAFSLKRAFQGKESK